MVVHRRVFNLNEIATSLTLLAMTGGSNDGRHRRNGIAETCHCERSVAISLR